MVQNIYWWMGGGTLFSIYCDKLAWLDYDKGKMKDRNVHM